MRKSGFTLLEILLVVGIIAILAGIVILAINPTKQLASVRNVQRKANLAELNKALYQYYIDNSSYPSSVTTTLTEICNTGATSTGHSINCTNKADLSFLVPTYLTAIPTDPQMTGTSTRYKVMKDPANKIVLTAPQAEYSAVIAIGTYCLSPITDSRDGKTYTTILIGEQCWMQQNLNVGTLVNSCNPNYTGVCTTGGSVVRDQGTSLTAIEKYCYNNLESGCDTNGGLYQWNQMMGASTTAGIQGICPLGFHIPTDTEYKTLVEGQATLGCESSTGWQCSPAGSHLSNLTLNHDNTSGFTALLAGYRGTDGSFDDLSGYTYLWSSLESGGSAWRRALYSGYATVNRFAISKSYGFSLRCLKD